MAIFERYAPFLMKWEASIPKGWESMPLEEIFAYAKTKGWSDNPKDNGGATMVGVTLFTYREYFGNGATKDDLRNITFPQWCLVMRRYWDRCKGDRIESQSIANLIVDWHVNAGVNAIKQMQRSLMLDADGIVGNVTLSYLNSPNRAVIFSRMKDARADYYCKIVERNPSQRIFLNGWLNRTRDFVFQED